LKENHWSDTSKDANVRVQDNVRGISIAGKSLQTWLQAYRRPQTKARTCLNYKLKLLELNFSYEYYRLKTRSPKRKRSEKENIHLFFEVNKYLK
jgi:hypothetical protein